MEEVEIGEFMSKWVLNSPIDIGSRGFAQRVYAIIKMSGLVIAKKVPSQLASLPPRAGYIGTRTLKRNILLQTSVGSVMV